MTDQPQKPKPPDAPSYASSPCSMHEFAADFGLDDDAREPEREPPQARPDAAEKAPHRDRDGD
jgi:hypothetical protein